jgi:hypothetical protein
MSCQVMNSGSEDLLPRGCSFLPDHLIAGAAGGWAFWRCVGLRGAGFPAELLLRLVFPDCAAAVERLRTAEAELEAARQMAHADINAALDSLRSQQAWHDKPRRRALLDALRALKRDEALAPETLGDTAVRALAAARAGLATAAKDYRAAYEAAVLHQSREIRALISEDRFQEAVLWQNRGAFRTALAGLLRGPLDGQPRTSQRRQSEELMASYLQRYAVKNDTIGFFGPVGWARFVGEGPAVDVHSGPDLLAQRNVYLESWCFEEVGRTLAENEAVKPWLVPRRLPFVQVNGTRLHLPMQSPVQLTPTRAALLNACDGERTAQEIARDLIRDPANGFKSEREVYLLLEHLRVAGLIAWRFYVPTAADAQQVLRRQIERFGNDRLRRTALGMLDEIERARQAIADAAGDVAQLDLTMARLEETFTRLTKTSATRHAGQMYAGRTLIYEDCRRDLDVQLGPDIALALEKPLGLVLQSARWLTFEASILVHRLFVRLYSDLVRESGSRVVEYIHFWYRLMGKSREIPDAVFPRLYDRWEEVLSVDYSQRRVQLASADLQERVSALFAAPGPGWQGARYHSPDVMIAAKDVAALQQGDYQLVLGELHISANTLNSSLFIAQHPDPEAVFRGIELDLPHLRFSPLTPKDFPGYTTRTHVAYLSPQNYFSPSVDDATALPAGKVLFPSALVIEDTANGLVVRTRDGRLQFDLVESFGDLLSFTVHSGFAFLRPRPHSPRISIDRLVICRESWLFSAPDLSFAVCGNGADRFLAARRWAESHDLPRFVFVKAAGEQKPIYVDFDSPIYVDIFAKIVRRTLEAPPEDQMIRVTEMLPEAEETWLPDAKGQRYTSELRIVAVDQTGNLPGHRQENFTGGK